MSVFRRYSAGVMIAVGLVASSMRMAAAANQICIKGGTAFTNTAATQLTTKDTSADGVRIYSDYYRQGSGKRYQLITTGVGQAVSSTGAKIYRFNVCRDVPVGLDSCKAWKYPA